MKYTYHGSYLSGGTFCLPELKQCHSSICQFTLDVVFGTDYSLTVYSSCMQK